MNSFFFFFGSLFFFSFLFEAAFSCYLILDRCVFDSLNYVSTNQKSGLALDRDGRNWRAICSYVVLKTGLSVFNGGPVIKLQANITLRFNP